MPKSASILYLFLAVSYLHTGGGIMNVQKVEYLSGELPDYPQQLTITHDSIRYESHSNLNQPKTLGIGMYERPLVKEELAAIETRIDPMSFRALPDHEGRVLAGDHWKRIRLTVDGEVINKLVGSTLSVDPMLQKRINELDRLVDEIVRHPRAVLQMHFDDVTVDSNGWLSGSLTFIHAGPVSATFHSLPAQSSAEDGSLVVYWWPESDSGIKTEVQSTNIVRTVQISTAMVPGAIATYRIQGRLRRPSSQPYIVQIRYWNDEPKIGTAEAPIGMLYSSPTLARESH